MHNSAGQTVMLNHDCVKATGKLLTLTLWHKQQLWAQETPEESQYRKGSSGSHSPCPCGKWGPVHRRSQSIYPAFPQTPEITYFED